MKIAELFVSLGFKVEGDKSLDKIDASLMRSQVSALKLLAGVAALNAGFLLLMNRAVDAAVNLDQWRRATRLSTDELQRMQYGAARSNVAAKSVAEALSQIQKVQTEIALGNVDASSPWFLLGIDPRQDPLKVFEQLRVALNQMEPALARNFVGRLGFSEDILYLLQQKKTLGGLFVTNEDISRLSALGGAWKGFLFTVSTLATKFAAVFAEGLTKVVNLLDRGAQQLDRFVRWLNSGSIAANTVKTVLIGLVAVMMVAGVALTALVGLLGALQLLLIGIQVMPVVLAFTAFAAVVAGLVLALGFLILMVQDFWTAVDGGKSRYDWNDGLILTIRNVERLAKALQWAITLMKQFAEFNKTQLGMFSDFGKAFLGKPQQLIGRVVGNAVSSGMTVNKNIEINVDGSDDPIRVGKEVHRNVTRELSDAQGQAPLPTW